MTFSAYEILGAGPQYDDRDPWSPDTTRPVLDIDQDALDRRVRESFENEDRYFFDSC